MDDCACDSGLEGGRNVTRYMEINSKSSRPMLVVVM